MLHLRVNSVPSGHIGPGNALSNAGTQWQQVEKYARQQKGFVAFKPSPKRARSYAVDLQPLPRQARARRTQQPAASAQAASMVFPVQSEPTKTKPLVVELLPFIAAAIGVPIAVWFLGRDEQRSI